MAEELQQFDNSHTIFLSSGARGVVGRELKPGTLIGGNYRLLSLLGRGGMGYVFRVEHTTMGRQYALKILAPEMSDDESRQRFEIEGKAIASMDHPNIVKVYDIGLDAGDCPYYVMDLLKGVSLTDYLESRPEMTLLEYLEICLHIASGLAYAHNKGVVHRDVKPSNVVLLAESHDGSVVKIVDFGIAKLLPTSSFASQSQTATGLICGSPPYMSPEHCLGKPVDVRSDIYALGCTFYEMLCGKPPFMGANAVATMIMHQTEPVPLVSQSALLPDIPRSVDALVAKMMAKEVEDRYQSMRQVIHDLERIKQGKGIGRGETMDFPTGSHAVFEQPLFGDAEAVDEKYSGTSHHIDMRVVAISLLAFACIAGGVFALSRQVFAVKDVPKDVKVRADLSEFEVDNPHARYYRVYQEAEPMNGTLVNRDGKPQKRFMFPEISVGRIFIDGHMKTECKGEQFLPADVPLMLQIGRGDSGGVFYYPKIAAKFGPADFAKLVLVGNTKKASDRMVVLAHEDGADVILGYAKNWTKLESLDLASVKLEKDLLDVIDTFPHLKSLAIHGCIISCEDLQSEPILTRLEQLAVGDLRNCGPLFKIMSRSSKINQLDFTDCGVTAADIESLQSASNLYCLYISQNKLARLIDPITRLPHLYEVGLSGGALTLDDAKKLADCAAIDKIRLQGKYYPRDLRREISALNPRKFSFG